MLILASQSPARAALLRAAAIPFDIRPAFIDEAQIKQECWASGRSADDTAIRLARLKAGRIAAPGRKVLGADQLLVCEGAWFDKPPTLAAARDHLSLLCGRPHELVTAMVMMEDGAEIWRHVATPRLWMRSFSKAFADAYVEAEGEALLTTVGAYRLEGRGIHLFDRIEGAHSAILGLPMLPLLHFLRTSGELQL